MGRDKSPETVNILHINTQVQSVPNVYTTNVKLLIINRIN